MSQTNKRLMMVGLIVLFALPVIGATVVFNFAPSWKPWGTSNKGTLIQPPKMIADLGLTRFSTTNAGNPKPIWTIAYLSESGCKQICLDRLYELQQLQIAMNKDGDRITRLFVSRDMQVSKLEELASGYPGLDTAIAAESWLTQFVLDETPPGTTDRTYLIDPKNLLMMYYEHQQPTNDLYKDLRRLLKLSRAG